MIEKIELFQTDSYVELKETIQKKYFKDIDLLNSKLQKFVDKNYDNIYFISSLKDININKYKLKIKKLEGLLEEQKNYNELLKKDGQISDEEAIKRNALLESDFKTKNFQKIKIIQEKINKYDLKMQAVIQKKTAELKALNLEKKNKIENIIEKINSKLAIQIENLESKKTDFISIDNQIDFKKIEKLKKSDVYKKYLVVQDDYRDKKIGNIFLEKNNNELEPKLIETKKIINEKTSSFALKKIKTRFAFSNTFGVYNKQKISELFVKIFNESKLLILILGIAIIAGISNSNFFTQRTWVNLLTNNLDLLLISFGMTLIILTGGIDLSVGSTLAFAGACSVKLLLMGISPWISILVCVIIAVIFGVVSGFLISYVKLQPFIVTLVLMLSLRGAASILLESKAVLLPAGTIQFITRLKLGIMPLSFFIALAIFGILIVIMRYYKYGRYIYAVGGNIKAAHLSGVKAKLILMSAYMFSNILVAIGTIIYISKLNSISPTSGNQIELDAIACVALGGTSLQGGKGGITKTLMGWFVISVLTTSMSMIGLNTYYQMIVKACVIMIAVLSDKKINIVKRLSNSWRGLIYRI